MGTLSSNTKNMEHKYYEIKREPKVEVKAEDFLAKAEEEKQELEESYRESLRQTNERKANEHKD